MHKRRAWKCGAFWSTRSNLTGLSFTVLPVASQPRFEFARKSCVLLFFFFFFFPLSCLLWSINFQVQFILLRRLAPLLIYLVVLICFDPSALLSGQLCALNSQVQPSPPYSRLAFVRHFDAHSEIIPISNGPLSGKQYVWRSRTQTGSSLAELAMNYITETQECHMFYSPGHGSL